MNKNTPSTRKAKHAELLSKLSDIGISLPTDFFDNLTDEQKDKIFEFLNEIVYSIKHASLQLYTKSGYSVDPFEASLTPELITKIISNDYREILFDKILKFGYFLMAVGTFIFICIYFTETNNKDLLFDILKIFGGFVAGLGVGFITRKKRDD